MVNSAKKALKDNKDMLMLGIALILLAGGVAGLVFL